MSDADWIQISRLDGNFEAGLSAHSPGWQGMPTRRCLLADLYLVVAALPWQRFSSSSSHFGAAFAFILAATADSGRAEGLE